MPDYIAIFCYSLPFFVIANPLIYKDFGIWLTGCGS